MITEEKKISRSKRKAEKEAKEKEKAETRSRALQKKCSDTILKFSL